MGAIEVPKRGGGWSLCLLRRACCLPLLAVLVLVGCSAPRGDRLPVFQVRGKVLVGGEPATEAFVAFHPDEGNPAPGWIVGQVDGDGNFALSTYVSGDGAPEGDYTVTIIWKQRGGPLNEFSGPDRLKGAYADPKTSKLHFRVEKKPVNEVPPYLLEAGAPADSGGT